MSLLEKVRQQPQAAKIRLMWIVSIVIVVLMIAVWIISAHFQKNTAKDMSLFQTIGQGIHNIRGNYNKK
jgi:flagellar basal body-associated protein FliL